MKEKRELLCVDSVCKSYGERKVVDEMKFSISEGEMVGFLGPNGAGKTTTIKMILGIEAMDSGDIYFMGKKSATVQKEMKQSIGIVPQDIAVYEDMSSYDNVRFFCSLYGYKKKELEERVKEALTFVGLWERRKDRPGTYSGGMKRRLNIACTIAHSPKLLILDEPTVGIDPQSRNHIIEALRILNERNTAIIYVSHYMEEIESLCNRIVIAESGKTIEDMEKEQLKEKYSHLEKNTLEQIFLHLTGNMVRDFVE